LWLLDPVTKYPAPALRALLIINEATDSTARFKLATKYTGVAMWDDEKGEWRVVVGLEWSKSKVAGIPKATRNDSFGE
jgi:hypothetical protein